MDKDAKNFRVETEPYHENVCPHCWQLAGGAVAAYEYFYYGHRGDLMTPRAVEVSVTLSGESPFYHGGSPRRVLWKPGDELKCDTSFGGGYWGGRYRSFDGKPLDADKWHLRVHNRSRRSNDSLPLCMLINAAIIVKPAAQLLAELINQRDALIKAEEENKAKALRQHAEREQRENDRQRWAEAEATRFGVVADVLNRALSVPVFKALCGSGFGSGFPRGGLGLDRDAAILAACLWRSGARHSESRASYLEITEDSAGNINVAVSPLVLAFQPDEPGLDVTLRDVLVLLLPHADNVDVDDATEMRAASLAIVHRALIAARRRLAGEDEATAKPHLMKIVDHVRLLENGGLDVAKRPEAIAVVQSEVDQLRALVALDVEAEIDGAKTDAYRATRHGKFGYPTVQITGLYPER